MTRSKPGQKLSPALKAASDAIYETNPVRYKELIVWIWRQQKYHASDESIAEALEIAYTNIAWADDWLTYLTSLMPKASARASEKENNERKIHPSIGSKKLDSINEVLESIMKKAAEGRKC